MRRRSGCSEVCARSGKLLAREWVALRKWWGGPPGPGVPSGDDALVGLLASYTILTGGTRASRADQGVRPTRSAARYAILISAGRGAAFKRRRKMPPMRISMPLAT